VSLSSEDLARWERHMQTRRAYGCRTDDAHKIVAGKTAFAHAAHHFGPMFCWYAKNRYRWTLFGQDRTKAEITKAAGIRRGRHNVVILPQ